MTRSFAALIRPLLLFGMLACASLASAQVDADGDGFETPFDCNDNDPAIFPGQGCAGCSSADIALLASADLQPSQDCVSSCSGAPDPIACLAQCYVLQGLGSPCATCLVEFQFCAATQCEECNTDPNSAACLACMQVSGCSAQFSACSGLVDADLDGYYAPFDCDDNNASVNPGAQEGCVIDGIDNDCNGLVDEGILTDADGDGFTACQGDCNDTDENVNPNATEICDGIDNNCNGIVDEGFPQMYFDADGDGFGDLAMPVNCTVVGAVLNNTDCDDADATTYPGAPEICDGLDNDCNGTVDDNLAEDTDNDGFSPCQGDCDDNNPTIFPGAPELCDGLDNDCDGFSEATIYADVDGDGSGDAANVVPCGSAGVTNNMDCDDTDPSITLARSWFPDTDGDGYGVYGPAVVSCTQPVGYANNSFDCDDTDAFVFPGQGCTECSPADLALMASNPSVTIISQACYQGCGGATDQQQCFTNCLVDNGLSASCANCIIAYQYCLVANCPICQTEPDSPACLTCVQNSGCAAGFTACSGSADADGDGYFTPIDCDDNNAAVYPDATEICDGLDNDCNGQVDEGFPQQYADNDGDGFGDLLQPLPCDTPGVANADDCDDNNPDIYPGSITGFNCMGCSTADQQNLSQGLHVQNGVLDGPMWTTTLQCAFSCSGQLDPAESIICFNTCMQSSASLGAGCSECFLIYIMTLLDPGCNACEVAALADFQACTGLIDDDGDGHFFPADCDDQDPELNPGALEVCDGIDNNCDGNVDDLPLFADADGDGFGDPAQPRPCGTPGGVENSSDCDDSSAAVNPIATEVCDGVDNDCDGQVDEGFERFADEDGDGYGDPLQPRACDGPGATNNLDCDDTNAAIYPEQGCSGCGFASQTILSQILHVESGTLAGPYLSVTLQCFNTCSAPLDPVASQACTVACLQSELSIGASCSQCLSDYISVAFAFECNAQCRTEALAQFIACSGLVDFDNDGYFAPTDCDDRNAAIHPGAPEVCDGIDNDCNGLVDEAGGLFADSDGDGFGNPNVILACGVPGVTNDLDCDDSNPGRYPGGPVPCPDCLPADQAIILSDPNYFANAGSCFPLCIGSQNLTSCFSDCLEGSLSIGADCADCMATYITCVYFSCTACLQDPYSAACNLCRTNSPCNAAYESCSGLIDNDGDGSYVLFDCDDHDPSVYPNAPELCDGLDNDCDGEIDEDNVCEVICTTDINLVFQTDGISTIHWEIRDQSTDLVVQSGGGLFPQSLGYGISTCLPDGCFHLAVFDDAGDGIVNGGYVLSLTTGERLIDDRNNFTAGAFSAISGGQGFCLPVGSDRLIFTACDKLDWVPSKYLVATANPSVAAEWLNGQPNSAQDANSGYEFWIFDPNGTYSYRRFRSHNVSDGFSPATANRACHMSINNWANTPTTPHIPMDMLLNVRVRGRVNGVNAAFGSTCRMKIDLARATCPLVKLQDNPNNTSDFSCGVIRNFGGSNSEANKLVAMPPQFYPAPLAGGTSLRYQFRFRIPGENVCIVLPPQTSPTRYLNWNTTVAPPLVCSRTYEVDVRVSKDGGSTWCVGGAANAACSETEPWGLVCNVTIACGQSNLSGSSSSITPEGALTLYPNPNRGDQLFVSITTLPLDVDRVTMDLFDLTGKLVTSRVLAAQDELLNTEVDLQGELGDGLYLVQFKAGASVWNQRLVIAR